MNRSPFTPNPGQKPASSREPGFGRGTPGLGGGTPDLGSGAPGLGSGAPGFSSGTSGFGGSGGGSKTPLIILAVLTVLALAIVAVLAVLISSGSVNLPFMPTPTPAPIVTPEPTPIPTPTPMPTPEPRLRPTSEVFDIYPEGTRVLYQQLTPEQKDIFSDLYDNILDPGKAFDLRTRSFEDYARATFVINHDCPELFLINRYDGSTLDVQTYRSDLARILDQLDALAKLPDFGTSDYSKELAIHQQIVKNTEIDYLPTCANADSVWLYGSANSTGYTRALNLALRYYGIPCTEMIALTFDDKGDLSETVHAWSVVQIGGEWYHCDTINNDRYNRLDPDAADPYYLPWFNVSDDMLPNSPRFYDIFAWYGFILPLCRNLDANYYVMNGLLVPAGTNAADAISRAMRDALNNGKTEIALLFESDEDYEDVLRNKDNIGGYISPVIDRKITWSQIIHDKQDNLSLYYAYNIR